MNIPILSRQTQDLASWRAALHDSGGVVLIDKELRWTSFDVVAKLRRIFHIKKIGHAGTLDPQATGLLIVCIGKATKQVEDFQRLDKEYQVTIKLGARTLSDDAETPEFDHQSIEHLTKSSIIATITSFVGMIEQVPPAYSAIHTGGHRLYELARQGKKLPSLPPRLVMIYSIDMIEVQPPLVRFTVRCSKGTYIRALARDIGARLGVGAYVISLRRTAIGCYRVADAWMVAELVERLYSPQNADLSQHQ